MSGILPVIREQIAQRGPLTVARYMELALQHPEQGYYRRHDPLGQKGDFTTAPEMSQMFGEMLGMWCADTWKRLGAPLQFILLELGPGRGTLLQDALRATAKVAGFHQALQLHLLESNQTLRQKQHEKLSNYLPVYVEDLTLLPALPLIIIANEFFDALPIRQFEKTFDGWFERLVTLEGEKLAFTLAPLDTMLTNMIPEHLRAGNPGIVYEMALPATALMRQMTKHIVRWGGAALIIDYGYVEPSGQPTLQAVSHHAFADVLLDPGAHDLSAHVDFSLLKAVASGQEANLFGPSRQGEFLEALGIDLRAMQLKQHATPKQVLDIDAALDRLISPSQMGNLFKVLAVTSQKLTTIAGF